jgi:hypothetical protein
VALTELKGQDMGKQTVRLEWGPAKTFAAAVTDRSPEYQTEDAVVAPTFPFAWGFMGTLEGRAGGLPIDKLRGPGRMILHGEQAFTYHRHPRVGDVLHGTARVSDVYERDTDSATMEFYVMETSWADAETGEPVVDATFTLIVRAKKA